MKKLIFILTIIFFTSTTYAISHNGIFDVTIPVDENIEVSKKNYSITGNVSVKIYWKIFFLLGEPNVDAVIVYHNDISTFGMTNNVSEEKIQQLLKLSELKFKLKVMTRNNKVTVEYIVKNGKKTKFESLNPNAQNDYGYILVDSGVPAKAFPQTLNVFDPEIDKKYLSFNVPSGHNWNKLIRDNKSDKYISEAQAKKAMNGASNIDHKSCEIVTAKFDFSDIKTYIYKQTKALEKEKKKKEVDEFEDMLEEVEDNENKKSKDDFEDILDSVEKKSGDSSLDSLEKNVESSAKSAIDELSQLEKKEQKQKEKDIFDKKIIPYKKTLDKSLQECENNKPKKPSSKFKCPSRNRGLVLSVEPCREYKYDFKSNKYAKCMERSEREAEQARKERAERRRKYCAKEKIKWQDSVREYPTKLKTWEENRIICIKNAKDRYTSQVDQIKRDLEELESLMLEDF